MVNQSQDTSKANMRKLLLERRLRIDPDRARASSAAICQSVVEILERRVTTLKTILIYLAHRGEPDVTGLAEWFTAIQPTGELGVPIVPATSDENIMTFARWKPGEPLVKNRFGIDEPRHKLPIIFSPANTAIVVPALAIDQKGYRLGFGKGFYDRFLADQNGLFSIGVTFDDFLLPEIPVASHDQALQTVVTETRRFIVNP